MSFSSTLAILVAFCRAEVVDPNAPHIDYDIRTKLQVYNTGDLRFWPSLPNADYNDTQPADPFERGKPLFPEKASSWSLDCDSGQALHSCDDATRPVCDAYCVHQCHEQCAAPMDQDAMSECLAANDAGGCSYNIDEYLWLPTKMCRTIVHFNTTQKNFLPFDGTVYIAEPDWTAVSLANFKRLKKAALVVPMAGEYNFSYTTAKDEIDRGSVKLPLDVGNLINSVDGFDVTTCRLDKLKMPFTVASLQNHDVFRADFGATYYKQVGGLGEAPFTYENDITQLLHARNLQLLGGLPKQLLIWWSGIQPALHFKAEVPPNLTLSNGDYTEDAILKVKYQYPPARYFRSGGFHTLTMASAHSLYNNHLPLLPAAIFVSLVFSVN